MFINKSHQIAIHPTINRLRVDCQNHMRGERRRIAICEIFVCVIYNYGLLQTTSGTQSDRDDRIRMERGKQEATTTWQQRNEIVFCWECEYFEILSTHTHTHTHTLTLAYTDRQIGTRARKHTAHMRLRAQSQRTTTNNNPKRRIESTPKKKKEIRHTQKKKKRKAKKKKDNKIIKLIMWW